MRETRQSGSEGGVAGNSHPYPYTSPGCNPISANIVNGCVGSDGDFVRRDLGKWCAKSSGCQRS